MRTKEGSTKERFDIIVQRKRNGRYSLGIALRDIAIKRSPDGLRYLMVKMNKRLPIAVECDGLNIKMHLVLHIGRKIRRTQRFRMDQMRKKQRLNAVMNPRGIV